MRSFLPEVVVAGVLTCAVAASALDAPGMRHPAAAGAVWVVAAGTSVPVLGRRRWPLWMLAISTGCAAGGAMAGVAGAGLIWVGFVPVALVLYSVAVQAPTAVASTALAVCVSAGGVAVWQFYVRFLGGKVLRLVPEWLIVEVALVVVAVMIGWASGRLEWWRRVSARGRARQAAHEAAFFERMRIAHELRAGIPGAAGDPAALTEVRRLLGELQVLPAPAQPVSVQPVSVQSGPVLPGPVLWERVRERARR